jgi:hypothetical protein
MPVQEWLDGFMHGDMSGIGGYNFAVFAGKNVSNNIIIALGFHCPKSAAAAEEEIVNCSCPFLADLSLFTLLGK